ncbi:putative zinc finger matrin-type protein 2 [Cocos nucifera]|uniref:Putative zinc finger matrin-type protein 2 n=1 Tax=Cocos nucifera TaxID=13894 RepID=A0A8K0MTH1_COCNU|nr:putative zinc finger matrin-type protein 2 [Cocos nucifera]
MAWATRFLAAVAFLVVGVVFAPDLFGSGPASPTAAVSVAKIAHLLCFATCWGAALWVTFIGGIIMFKYLPRHQFGNLQSKMFPAYFMLISVCAAISVMAFAYLHPWKSASSLERYQLGFLLSALVFNLSNLLVFTPMTIEAVGVDNTFRRKWNREEYLERAREREKEEKDEESHFKSKAKAPPVQRKPLKHRDFEVDLESRLGKTQVVTPIAPLSQQAGYYCEVCECVVKDSANYLDHINGKKHQRALGMSMRVERATLQQVQERFETLKKRKAPGSFTEQVILMNSYVIASDLDERILKQQQEEEERKRQRRERKKEKKKEKAVQDESEDIDPDVAAMMGFGGFRSSKK